MKYVLYFLAGMVTVVLILLLSPQFAGPWKMKEKAYFEGQRDAINGDVKIKLEDSIYVWTKSPWNDGRKPKFNPSKKDTK